MSNDPRLLGFNPIVDLMTRIKASGNDWPKVRLAFGNYPLQLRLNARNARFPGAVAMTDGRAFGVATYYGMITAAGVFVPSYSAAYLTKDKKRALWSLLTRLKSGEAEQVFAEFGKKFGTCCLCGRELTNEESVELGIGPICRERAFG